MEMAREALPSLIKRQPEDFVDTLSTNVSVSPSDSHSSFEATKTKKLKPWELTASRLDVNTEMHGKANDEVEVSREIGVENKKVRITAQSFKLQAHLRGMQWHLDTLHKLTQEAARQSRHHLPSQGTASTNSATFTMMMKQQIDRDQSLGLQTSVAKKRVDESSRVVSASTTRCSHSTLNGKQENGDRNEQTATISSEEGPPAISVLLNQVKSLRMRLREAIEENQQLQSTVYALKQDNARLLGQTMLHPPNVWKERISTRSTNNQKAIAADKSGEDHDKNIPRVGIAIFGDQPDFRMVIEEDLKVLKNHERCQYKSHELWNAVRKLMALVKTYEIERNVFKIQRDDAVAQAESAIAENIKLTSGNNPQQKIKYLQQLKNDNQALRHKNHLLNEKIAKQTANLVPVKIDGILAGGCDLSDDSANSVSFDVTLQTIEHHTFEHLLRRMQNFSVTLEQRLQSLLIAKQDLTRISKVRCHSTNQAL